MFKWFCLALAALFLIAILWILNDIRLEIHSSSQRVQKAGETINENLPAIVDRTRQTTETLAKNLPQVVSRVDGVTRTVSDNLPELVERVSRTTEVIAELAEDIRQLKELAGVTNMARDKNLVAYADGLLKTVEGSGGTIGLRKTVGKGLKNTKPAAEWVSSARKEALILTLLGRSKKEMLNALAKTKFGAAWMIELPDREPVPLLDWLREHHPDSKTLE